MNRVMLLGRLTRDPEMRTLADGGSVTSFTVATVDRAVVPDRAEYHAVVAWGRLAEVTGTFLGRRQLISVEGRLETRSWDDDRGRRHWRTEVVAERVDILSGPSQVAMAAVLASDALAAERPSAASAGLEASQ